MINRRVLASMASGLTYKEAIRVLDLQAFQAAKKKKEVEMKPKAEMKPIVPEVCDRLGCKVTFCYGWDLCRQAREEATPEEWEKLCSELFKEAEE